MPNRVYLGRLSIDARERDIEHFFKGYGRIKSILIKENFAFIEFDNYRDADDAVHELNGKMLCGDRVIVEHSRESSGRGYGDRSFGRNPNSSFGRSFGRGGGGGAYGGGGGFGGGVVFGSFGTDFQRSRGSNNRSLQRSGKVPERTKYRLVVENLSTRVSWQDLKDYMRRAGEVRFADAHRNREGEGVVEFSTEKDMNNAIDKLDGTELKGRRIKLIPPKNLSRSRSRSNRSSRSRSYSSRSRSHSKRRSNSRHKKRSRSRSRSRDSRSWRKNRKSKSRNRSWSRSSVSPKKDAGRDGRDRSKSKDRKLKEVDEKGDCKRESRSEDEAKRERKDSNVLSNNVDSDNDRKSDGFVAKSDNDEKMGSNLSESSGKNRQSSEDESMNDKVRSIPCIDKLYNNKSEKEGVTKFIDDNKEGFNFMKSLDDSDLDCKRSSNKEEKPKEFGEARIGEKFSDNESIESNESPQRKEKPKEYSEARIREPSSDGERTDHKRSLQKEDKPNEYDEVRISEISSDNEKIEGKKSSQEVDKPKDYGEVRISEKSSDNEKKNIKSSPQKEDKSKQYDEVKIEEESSNDKRYSYFCGEDKYCKKNSKVDSAEENNAKHDVEQSPETRPKLKEESSTNIDKEMKSTDPLLDKQKTEHKLVVDEKESKTDELNKAVKNYGISLHKELEYHIERNHAEEMKPEECSSYGILGKDKPCIDLVDAKKSDQYDPLSFSDHSDIEVAAKKPKCDQDHDSSIYFSTNDLTKSPNKSDIFMSPDHSGNNEKMDLCLTTSKPNTTEQETSDLMDLSNSQNMSAAMSDSGDTTGDASLDNSQTSTEDSSRKSKRSKKGKSPPKEINAEESAGPKRSLRSRGKASESLESPTPPSRKRK